MRDRNRRAFAAVALKVDPKVLQAYYERVDRVARGGTRAHEALCEMAGRLASQAASGAGRQGGSARSCTCRSTGRVPFRASSRTFHPVHARCCADVPASSCARNVGSRARTFAAHATPTLSPTSPSDPAPDAEASTSAPVAREAEPIPPPPLVPVPPSPSAPARSPAAQASMSAGLGQNEPATEVAPESLAQLRGAWAQSTADCKKLFQRRGGALTYRQPVDQFAIAADPSAYGRLPVRARVIRTRRAQGERRVSRLDQLRATNCICETQIQGSRCL